MKKISVLFFLLLLVLSCEDEPADKLIYVYSVVLKNDTSSLSKAIIKGAEDAAKEYSELYDVDIFIDKKFPDTQDSAGLEKLMIEVVNTASYGLINGIALSCINSPRLNSIINQGAVNGVRIMTFESDAPNSLRYAYFGPNHYECGGKLVQLVAEEIQNTGKIAIITGKENTNCYQERLKGILDGLKKYPSIELIENGIRYTDETPNSAVQQINYIYENYPSLDAVIVSYSEVFTLNDVIPWEPGKLKIVTIDGFPNQYEYLKKGYFSNILGINYYNYGYNSISALIKLTIKKEEPENDKNYFYFKMLNLNNIDEWFNLNN